MCNPGPGLIDRSLLAESKENFFPRKDNQVMSTAQLIAQDSVGSYID